MKDIRGILGDDGSVARSTRFGAARTVRGNGGGTTLAAFAKSGGTTMRTLHPDREMVFTMPEEEVREFLAAQSSDRLRYCPKSP